MSHEHIDQLVGRHDVVDSEKSCLEAAQICGAQSDLGLAALELMQIGFAPEDLFQGCVSNKPSL